MVAAAERNGSSTAVAVAWAAAVVDAPEPAVVAGSAGVVDPWVAVWSSPSRVARTTTRDVTTARATASATTNHRREPRPTGWPPAPLDPVSTVGRLSLPTSLIIGPA